MKRFLKENLDWIIISILTIVIIALNIASGKIIMGLDNSSPYFNPISILSRIKDTSTVIFGGLLFQIPFLQILTLIGLTPEIISNIYVFGNLITGVIGFTLLLRRDSENHIATVIAFLTLISNLFFFWILNHPNFLFIASFGSIPVLIYLLSEKTLNWKKYILIGIFSIFFLTTSLNLIAVAVYSLLIILLSYILSEERNIKRLILWIFSIFTFWFISLQTVMIINNDKTFLPVRIYEYTQELKENPYVTSSTEGILESEKTNTLTRTARYALGWMELHDSKEYPIFESYEQYRESTDFELIGLLPILLAGIAVFLKTDRKNILLTILLGTFILLSSKYGISLIDNIPYIKDAFRWMSSKIWPIYIIPMLLLVRSATEDILKDRNIFSKICIALLIAVPSITYGLPILNGNLISETTQVNIPSEYLEIPTDSKILILPHPQRQYMRQYDWGYYGSDFLVHITNSEIVDGANLFEYAREYEEIFDTKQVPEDIDYVIYDRSAETNLDAELRETGLEIVESLELINSNDYFNTYAN